MASEIAIIIEEEYREANKKYTKLNAPVAENDSFVISGQIDVIDGDGIHRRTYDVKIVVPADYPQNAPKLYEVDEVIKRDEDWHINNKSGECCVAPRIIEIKLFTSGGRLLHWLDAFAHSYLANHAYKDKYGEYANEGFPHGAKGIILAYIQEWGLKNKNEVWETLRLVTGRKKRGRNEKCLCGSGKKSKHCHNNHPLEQYLGVPLHILEKDLADIERDFKII